MRILKISNGILAFSIMAVCICDSVAMQRLDFDGNIEVFPDLLQAEVKRDISSSESGKSISDGQVKMEKPLQNPPAEAPFDLKTFLAKPTIDISGQTYRLCLDGELKKKLKSELAASEKPYTSLVKEKMKSVDSESLSDRVSHINFILRGEKILYQAVRKLR